MYNGNPHPLLAQVPLTVSPYISLPTAPTLPYTYKSLPSTLPPSSTADANGQEREKYVVAPSGHSARPEEIIASCKALQAHIQKVHDDAELAVAEWEKELKDQELAEKRRVAPGWLDRNEKILEPKRATESPTPMTANIMDHQDLPSQPTQAERENDAEGEAIDRAFGGLGLGSQDPR